MSVCDADGVQVSWDDVARPDPAHLVTIDLRDMPGDVDAWWAWLLPALGMSVARGAIRRGCSERTMRRRIERGRAAAARADPLTRAELRELRVHYSHDDRFTTDDRRRASDWVGELCV
jgi:hypothetical protein